MEEAHGLDPLILAKSSCSRSSKFIPLKHATPFNSGMWALVRVESRLAM